MHGLQGVRQRNFKRVKRQIEDSLFIAKPTFSAHLREICEWKVYDLEGSSLWMG
jgi:hypothetical protein